ncbi:c-type cytochrome [Aridibaculum aurantiacum]|uniref:c-type cytochrome n=1 Tax=Aridibaculum aurantiacum TaxID=2810307 RepID=UPI001A96A6A5|nr:c-type cytochrome [Aridibaculum aurantiacum]
MTKHRRIAKTIVSSVTFALFFLFTTNIYAQPNGQALFSSNCASCHAVHKDLTGPKLAGVEERWGNQENLYKWIKNSSAYLKTGDQYAVSLWEKWNRTNMPAFNLSDEEIGAILTYINSVPDPALAQPVPGVTGAQGGGEGDNTLLYGILTLVLAIVVLILLQVNSSLRKLSAEKQGEPVLEPVPFWRNKVYIATFTIILFCIGGYLTVTGAIGLGRSQNYQPEQPIYYSHKVHAGTNQISCLYCHGGAQEGKHANIPSLNICMNCHMAVNEYTGTDKLYKEDGTEVNGTAEIQKLYKMAGYEPGKPWDPSKGKPIEWVKIHNLPDHVYFNHAQHVTAGKVACQTCHGEIQNMDEVKQFADLSMGWCVNCHRETKVQFQDNGFYSIYQKFHDDLKNGKIDSARGITVEKIGGTECQKCHY